jgi:3-carboxy-cis,cis-muconate cycloisomerase
VAFSELLCLAASCAERTSGILGSIQLHPERMLANLEASGGLLFADRVAAELAQGLPGEDGAALTAKLVERALGKGVNFKQLVLEEPGIRAAYGAGTIATWFDPLENLGSARELVDAALARFAGPV